jgi:hypothetical protein
VYIEKIKLPLQAELSASQTYEFSLSSADLQKVALINNGQYKYFEQKENVFSLNYKPNKGELDLAILKNKWNTERFYSVFQYGVK